MMQLKITVLFQIFFSSIYRNTKFVVRRKTKKQNEKNNKKFKKYKNNLFLI